MKERKPHANDEREYLGAPPCADCTPTCTCTRHLKEARASWHVYKGVAIDPEDAALATPAEERKTMALVAVVCIAFVFGAAFGAGCVHYCEKEPHATR